MSTETIRTTGIVTAQHRGDLFAVAIDVGGRTSRALVRRAGRLVVHRIVVVVGDVVEVELSPFDPSRGRIVFRGRRGELVTKA